MSLKAKVEAVVYAAEEPVTLAQLAVLFAAEALPAPVDEIEQTGEQIALAGLAEEPVAAETEVPSAENGQSLEAAAENSEPPAPDPADDEKKAARLRDKQVRGALQRVLDELIGDYANSDRGMEIREIAGGYRMATKPEYHDAVRGFVKSLKPPMKLSLQALETLAVIAYKQPVTAPEVSEIRGVDSGGVLGGLVSRKLITTAGRKQVIGRPILYKTTKEFLLRFGLKDVNDLPSMEEFEKMAGELAESEADGEAQDAANSAAELPFAEQEVAAAGIAEAAEDEAPAETSIVHAMQEDYPAPEAQETEAHEPGTQEPEAEDPELHQPQAQEPDTQEPEAQEPDLHDPQAHEAEPHESQSHEAAHQEPEADAPHPNQPEPEAPSTPDKADHHE